MSTTIARTVRQLASTGRMSSLAVPVLADAADHIDKLTAQRDDLLLALKELLHASPASGWERMNAHRRAAEAIAKCEGREVNHGA
jgi:hypothetical protein